MNKSTFSYQYSAKRNKEVEAIRKRYMPYEESKLDILRQLDCRVQNAGLIESLCLGIIGALAFGIGICFFLEIFAGATWIAALFMMIGMFLMIPAYPIRKRISKRKKEELTPEILRLSEEIMKS